MLVIGLVTPYVLLTAVEAIVSVRILPWRWKQLSVGTLVVVYSVWTARMHLKWAKQLEGAADQANGPRTTTLRFWMRELFLLVTAICVVLGGAAAFHRVYGHNCGLAPDTARGFCGRLRLRANAHHDGRGVSPVRMHFMTHDKPRPSWILLASSILNAVACVLFTSFALAAFATIGWDLALALVGMGLAVFPTATFVLDEYRAILHRNQHTAPRLSRLVVLLRALSFLLFLVCLVSALSGHPATFIQFLPAMVSGVVTAPYLHLGESVRCLDAGAGACRRDPAVRRTAARRASRSANCFCW